MIEQISWDDVELHDQPASYIKPMEELFQIPGGVFSKIHPGSNVFRIVSESIYMERYNKKGEITEDGLPFAILPAIRRDVEDSLCLLRLPLHDAQGLKILRERTNWGSLLQFDVDVQYLPGPSSPITIVPQPFIPLRPEEKKSGDIFVQLFESIMTLETYELHSRLQNHTRVLRPQAPETMQIVVLQPVAESQFDMSGIAQCVGEECGKTITVADNGSGNLRMGIYQKAVSEGWKYRLINKPHKWNWKAWYAGTEGLVCQECAKEIEEAWGNAFAVKCPLCDLFHAADDGDHWHGGRWVKDGSRLYFERRGVSPEYHRVEPTKLQTDFDVIW